MENVPEQNAVTEPQNNEIKQMNLDDAVSRVRKAAYWFFGIAILSIVNTYMLAKGSYFILGLGVTQIVDGIVQELTGDTNFLISMIVPMIFIALGYFAFKLQRWAFIVGGIFYLLDAVIYVFASEWLAFAFHLYVLYTLFRGYQAIAECEEISESIGQ